MLRGLTNFNEPFIVIPFRDISNISTISTWAKPFLFTSIKHNYLGISDLIRIVIDLDTNHFFFIFSSLEKDKNSYNKLGTKSSKPIFCWSNNWLFGCRFKFSMGGFSDRSKYEFRKWLTMFWRKLEFKEVFRKSSIFSLKCLRISHFLQNFNRKFFCLDD